MVEHEKEEHQVETGLTHEKVVCVWIGPANAEELHEIVKLAMNVAANCYRAFLETALDIGYLLEAPGTSSPPAARSTPLEELLEPRGGMVRKTVCVF
jgi:hypothetical protein